ncbi:PLC-like phosphodiesterase [Kalaharituber pfeilii]|nr:PLC-like phosphodiesterase [Kalaharituber pfeilii]
MLSVCTYDIMSSSLSECRLPSKYPENTMSSFRGAVNLRTHALETDLHITRDNVVVLSHDATLLRCFGVDKRIIDCDYSYIKTLRTLKSPPEEMPTLKELLIFLLQPAVIHTWLLLDIKLDNNPEDVLRLTAEVLREVGGGGAEMWEGRVVLGIWALSYVSLCEQYLPGFPITHIGICTTYARQFLKIPGVSFNMYHAVLANRCGLKFVEDARKAGREVYSWTINDESLMKWSIHHQLAGVCVDDVGEYFRVCREYKSGENSKHFWGWKKELQLRGFAFLGWLFTFLLRWKYCGGLKGVKGERKMLEQHLQLIGRLGSRPETPVVVD